MTNYAKYLSTPASEISKDDMLILETMQKHKNLIAELNSLDFLVGHTTVGSSYKEFLIKNTPYSIEIVYHIYTGEISKRYVGYGRNAMEFEDFFERQTEDIKEKIIFHLDLFR